MLANYPALGIHSTGGSGATTGGDLARAMDMAASAPPRHSQARSYFCLGRAGARGRLERVRRQGYAENRDEWIPGLSAIAAPVLVAERMVAAVAVATSSPRLEALRSAAIARRIVEAARRIGERMEGGTR